MDRKTLLRVGLARKPVGKMANLAEITSPLSCLVVWPVDVVEELTNPARRVWSLVVPCSSLGNLLEAC